jgi:hypothetical protein
LGVGGRKRKQKKKAWRDHQRIYIRRSIRKAGLEGIIAEAVNGLIIYSY